MIATARPGQVGVRLSAPAQARFDALLRSMGAERAARLIGCPVVTLDRLRNGGSGSRKAVAKVEGALAHDRAARFAEAPARALEEHSETFRKLATTNDLAHNHKEITHE